MLFTIKSVITACRYSISELTSTSEDLVDSLTLLISHGITTFDSLNDLNLLTNLAQDRGKWRKIADKVFAAAQAEELQQLWMQKVAVKKKKKK